MGHQLLRLLTQSHRMSIIEWKEGRKKRKRNAES